MLIGGPLPKLTLKVDTLRLLPNGEGYPSKRLDDLRCCGAAAATGNREGPIINLGRFQTLHYAAVIFIPFLNYNSFFDLLKMISHRVIFSW